MNNIQICICAILSDVRKKPRKVKEEKLVLQKIFQAINKKMLRRSTSIGGFLCVEI